MSYSDGRSYPSYDVQKDAPGFYQVADINGDGKADIVGLGLTEKVKQTPILLTQGFFVDSEKFSEYEPNAGFAVLHTEKVETDVISQVTSSDGKEIKITYTLKDDVDGTVKPNTGEYPNLPDTSPEALVTQVESKSGTDSPVNKTTYKYEDKRYMEGTEDELGDMGFKTVTKVHSQITDEGEKVTATEVTEYNQNDPFDYGKPVSMKEYNEEGNLQHVTTFNREKVATSPNGTYTVRVKSEDNAIYENGNLLFTNNRTYTYDANGNITKEVSSSLLLMTEKFHKLTTNTTKTVL